VGDSISKGGLHIVDEDDDALLTTGDMARLSGSTLRTVRFYEQEGLIRPKTRTEGGRRQFEKTELQRLQLALDLREGGLSITDIKSLFELKSRYDTPQEATDEITSILTTQIDVMQEKIAKLRRVREELSSMMSVISECRTCSGVGFPSKCGNCDVLDRPELPRAVHVLWS